MKKLLCLLFLFPLLSFSQRTKTDYFFAGKKLYESDSLDKAVVVFSKVIALDSTFSPAYYFRGLTLRKYRGDNVGRFDSAERDFKKCIALSPDSNYLKAYQYLGEKAIYRNPDSAVFYFDKAIRLNPDNYELYWKRGKSKYENVRHNWYVKEQLDGFKEALLDYERAIKLNDKDYRPFQDKFEIEWRWGMNQEALDDINKVLTLHPDTTNGFDTDILFKKAIVLCLLGRKADSQNVVERFNLITTLAKRKITTECEGEFLK